MPTTRTARSAATAAVLLLSLTGCSLFDRDSGDDRAAPEASATSVRSATAAPSVTRSPSPSASPTASVSTVRETCDRAGEAAEGAQQRLREDPEGLLAEIDALAETAPPELSGEIADVREAVDDYRKGDRSYLGVLREAKALQDRCAS